MVASGRRGILGVLFVSVLVAGAAWGLRSEVEPGQAGLHHGPAPAAQPGALSAEPSPSVAADPVITRAAELSEALPAPQIYAERPVGEWQGMRIRPDDHWPCSQEGVCSMARACVQGQCSGCTEDAQCGQGEACVMDHCVLENHVECRRAADCGDAESKCVLSGVTAGDARGNAEMRAYCLSPWGGQEG